MSSTSEPVRPGMSHAPYPSYKDASIDWLPRIPSHWTTEPLKRLVHLRSGDAITADRIGDDGDYPVFGGNGRRGFTSSWTHDGDHVLIGRQGALCGNINYASGRFWASEHAIVATPRQPLEPHWLGETLRAMNLNQYSLSAAQPGLSVEQVGRLRVPLPPGGERSAIAAFLDRETAKIDALVAEQERLIELLKEKRQAVISHAVTKGLHPNARMKPSGIDWLGEIPAHWALVAFRRLISRIEQGWSPNCESFPATEDEWGVLKVGCVNGDTFDASEQKALPAEVAPVEDYAVSEGDLLMSRGNTADLVGMASVVGPVTHRLLLSDLLYRIRLDVARTVPDFVVMLLRSATGRYQIERLATGTSASMKKISQSDIRELVLPVPPIDEQLSIIAFAHQLRQSLDSLSRDAASAIRLLRERRSTLISAAVTGQIDVRGLADAEVA